MKAHDAANYFALSRATLQRHKETGEFKKGVHWMKIGTCPKSDVIWDVNAMHRTMSQW